MSAHNALVWVQTLTQVLEVLLSTSDHRMTQENNREKVSQLEGQRSLAS